MPSEINLLLNIWIKWSTIIGMLLDVFLDTKSQDFHFSVWILDNSMNVQRPEILCFPVGQTKHIS